MTRYWHIAHPAYQTGDDLLCRSQLLQEGRAPEWSWNDADEGLDGDVVCLFPDTADGRQQADWLWYERPDHTLLAVDLPDDAEITHVDEGYPAIVGHIPAAWVTVVRVGYVDGAIQ
jgi:hypothetical protein